MMHFLKGLNDKFSAVRSQILLMAPLPPIKRVFGLIAQQERQLSSELVDDSKLVLAAGNPGFNSGMNSQKKFVKGKQIKNQSGATRMCSHCGKSGHTVDQCFKKHGFPPNFKKGHGSAANCVSSDVVDEEDQPAGETPTASNFSLTKDQYQSLLALLQQSQLQNAQSNTPQAHSLNQISSSPSNSSNSGIHTAGHVGHPCSSLRGAIRSYTYLFMHKLVMLVSSQLVTLLY